MLILYLSRKTCYHHKIHLSRKTCYHHRHNHHHLHHDYHPPFGRVQPTYCGVKRNSARIYTFLIAFCGAIWWPCLQPMQVMPSGGQIWNSCKWRHLVGKFATNVIGTIWWSKLESICKWCIRWQNWQPMQVAPSGGQICNQFKKFH